ncbi:hypothetical protein APHAL10511_000613 [Amanita phalloides]|nr:hypothetical protein APHAL10511_000613 [Amanita phalloides]
MFHAFTAFPFLLLYPSQKARVMLSALDKTLGAAFGGVVAWYYFTHQNDTWSTKGLVSAVMIFDTVHQILITHTVYTYVITYFGDSSKLGDLVWSLIVEVAFNGLTGFLVQGFLALRVWRLSNGNIWLTTAILLLVVGEFACVIVYTGLAIRFETFAQLAALKDLSLTVNILAASGDVLIAGALCTLLHKSRTGFRRSDTMINKLIIFSVNTGCITSLCAIASLISITVAGNTFFYIAFFFCIGRLYANSLLATLNARKMIGGSDGIHSISDNSFSLRSTPNMTGSRRTANISIKIDTTKDHTHESDNDNNGGQSSFDREQKDTTPAINAVDYV